MKKRTTLNNIVYVVIYRDETQVKEERIHYYDLDKTLKYIFDNNLELIGLVKL